MLHTKVILRRKQNCNDNINKYKARFVPYGSKGVGNEEEKLSPILEFSIIKLIISVARWRGWHAKHFNLQNACLNGRLELVILVKLPRSTYNDVYRRSIMIKLERGLYGLKGVVRIWQEMVGESCQRIGLKEIPGALWVLTDNGIIAVYYANELFLFTKHQTDINRVQNIKNRFFWTPCENQHTF